MSSILDCHFEVYIKFFFKLKHFKYKINPTAKQ